MPFPGAVRSSPQFLGFNVIEHVPEVVPSAAFVIFTSRPERFFVISSKFSLDGSNVQTLEKSFLRYLGHTPTFPPA